MSTEVTNKKYFSGTTLKLIAIITMLIDHFGAIIIQKQLGLSMFQEQYESMITIYYILRNIGRIAFPIFCFLIVEGFLHTRNVKKYAFRLFIFALISEIPFDLAFSGKVVFINYQNVFFTLLIGLITIWSLDYIINIMKDNNRVLVILTILSISFIGMLLAYIIKTDYSYIGVLLIIIFYTFRYNRKIQCVVGAISFLWEPTSIVAFILMYLYNGQRGIKLNKYIFYAFYPIHLFILYIASMFII